ncbi:MAG: DUF427 domain-containing protein [Sphingobium phenoxybenzoativorans]
MAGTLDHPITITPYEGEVRILHAGREIVRTRKALSLKEASYPAVLYVPREDTDMGLLSRNDRTTHCPYKGDASYFDLPGAPAAVWSYETPRDDVGEIAGHLAFYPDKVTIEV